MFAETEKQRLINLTMSFVLVDKKAYKRLLENIEALMKSNIALLEKINPASAE